MTESLADLLKKLRFVGQPVETLYLNETRVHENFIGQLGAIESFTRSVTKEGSAEAPVIRIGAGLSSATDVTWTLSDPLSQERYSKPHVIEKKKSARAASNASR